LLVAIGAAGIVAAGASAFTAGGTLPNSTGARSYAAQTITGLDVVSVAYRTVTSGATYDLITLVVNGDTTIAGAQPTASTVKIGWNGAAPVVCSDLGTYSGVTFETTYACTSTQDVNGASLIAITGSR
jgi:hypothetical protein